MIRSLAFSLSLLTPPALAIHGDVRIQEFLALNSGGLLDEDGDDSDWIEIHNASSAALNLAGWSLTDDESSLGQWSFPSTSLPAGGYLVVFASGKDRAVSGAELHTNFKLSGGGEFLALVGPDGVTIESSYAPAYPAQKENISYGLKDTSLEEGSFDPPTPGGPNGDKFAALRHPIFSTKRGLHDVPFQLVLSHPESAAQIYYTLDGRSPLEGGTLYTGPITVDRTRIVRAAARLTGFATSDPGTHTYVFPEDVLLQSDATALADGFPADWIEEDGTNWTLGGSRPGAWYGFDNTILGTYTTGELREALASLPTLSLVMHPEDWFGDATSGERAGIYCNSEDAGDEWDRPGSAEFFDDQGGPRFQIDCGIAIQGGSSTGQALRNQLSIALKFSSDFGPTKLRFPLYEENEVDDFDTLVLDAGNQNSPNGVGNYDKKRHAQGLRDAFISDLQRSLGGSAAQGRFVHLYLNGLYWGVYDLHERMDHRAAASYADAEPEEFDYVKEGSVRYGNSNSWNDSTAPGAWKTAVEIAKNGLSPADTWQGQSAYEAFGEWFDVEDYADYLLANYYGGNTDWPQNNWVGTSHSRTGPDWTMTNPDNPGWRWHSWDSETVLWWGGAETAVGDGFWDRTSVTSTWSGSIVFFYTYLRENPEWRMLFADRAHEHLFHGALFVDPAHDQAGTPFDPDHPERNAPAAMYHALSLELEPAVMLEYARWGNYWGSPGTITPADWQDERKRLLEDYFPVRSGVLLAQLRNAQPRLYPLVDAPIMEPHGGSWPGGVTVSLGGGSGATIYYTTDGSDPRLPGGGINPTALVYSSPFALVGPTLEVKARAFDGTEWSALEHAPFAVGVEVVVNELVARNVTTYFDSAGRSGDWVELKNLGNAPVDLSGWSLSDKPSNPHRWTFPAGSSIPARDYLIVWCDDDELQGPLHTSFDLKATGEAVLLSTPPEDGGLLMDQVIFPAVERDRAFGRHPDGRGPFYKLPDATPDARNTIRPTGPQLEK